MSEEKLEFKRPFLVFGNLLLLGWVFLAFAGAWLYNQIYGYLLLVLTAAMVFLVLRRLGCSSCYYCKTCTSGFGRLAGVFFGTGNMKKGSVGNRVGLVAFIYFLLFVVPVAFLALSLSAEVTVLKILILVLLVVVSVCSFSTWTSKRTPAAKTLA